MIFIQQSIKTFLKSVDFILKQAYIVVMEFFLWPFVFILLPLPYFVRHWMKPANNEQTTVINALRVPFFQQISAFALSTTQQYRPKAKIPLSAI